MSSESRAAVASSFFPISSTQFVVERASIVVYNLELSFYFKKLISMLFRVKKAIFNTISMLIFTKKKVSSKN